MPQPFNAAALHAEYQRNPRQTHAYIAEAVESRQLTLNDISIRDLAEAFLGESVVRAMEPHRKSGGWTLREAAGAVDTTAFSNITGQIIYLDVKQEYQLAAMLADMLCRTRQSPFPYGERVPGVGGIGDQAEVVQEGMPYPTVGLNEEYIDYPAPSKRGFIVPITREITVYDRTGVLKDRASKGAKWLGLNKEKRVLDTVFGVTNSYKRNGTALNTYLTSGAYINNQANTLVDWTDIENAELLFDAMTDPNTGEPLGWQGDMTLIVPSALKMTAHRIARATSIRFNDAASNTTAAYGQNPVDVAQGRLSQSAGVNVLSTQYVKSRTGSASTWFYGRPQLAFVYNEVWGIESSCAPTGTQAQFERDIEIQHKVSEFGTPGVEEPRFMTKNT